MAGRTRCPALRQANAVGVWGNRRHRKMQKAVYRVRKQETLQGRLALDLQREAQASDRLDTLTTLHQSRQ